MESDWSDDSSSDSSVFSSASSDSALPRQQGRKRLRRVEQWKRKSLKDSGKAHETYKGALVSSKSMKLSLSCRCQNHCASRVCVRERKRIFDDFYSLADHDSQNKYLYRLIERSVPKQRRPRRSATKKARRNSFYYYIRLSSGDLVKICKQAFCEIHRVGKRRVENLCEKVVSGVLFSGDNRGKHDN